MVSFVDCRCRARPATTTKTSCHSPARPCSSPAPRAASGSPSRCAPRATAPTSRSRPRPTRRIQSFPAPSTRPPPRSRPRAAMRCRSWSTCATRRRSRRRSTRTAAHFGGLDIVVNNASAISLTPGRRDRHAPLRPHASGQHARHLHGVEIRHPASRTRRQPAHPDAVAAARHEGEMVRAAHRLFDRQVRHEPRRARASRASSRPRASPSTRCGRAPPSRPRRSRTCSAATR